jgi:hypothetical protein
MSFLISAKKYCHIPALGAPSALLTKEQRILYPRNVHVERKKGRQNKKNVFLLELSTLVFGEASLAVMSAPENSEMLPE